MYLMRMARESAPSKFVGAFLCPLPFGRGLGEGQSQAWGGTAHAQALTLALYQWERELTNAIDYINKDRG